MNILVLCTGNSCRSQMAEGWFRHFLGNGHRVCSAGVSPSSVHPMAIRVMAEAGVDISHQVSTHVNVYLEDEFDHVITVCDHARETCPIIPGAASTVHHSFSDPATFAGTEEEVLSAFMAIRDEIMDFCRQFSSEYC